MRSRPITCRIALAGVSTGGQMCGVVPALSATPSIGDDHALAAANNASIPSSVVGSAHRQRLGTEVTNQRRGVDGCTIVAWIAVHENVRLRASASAQALPIPRVPWVIRIVLRCTRSIVWSTPSRTSGVGGGCVVDAGPTAHRSSPHPSGDTRPACQWEALGHVASQSRR